MSLQTGLIHYLFSNSILSLDLYPAVIIASVLVVIAAAYLLGSINSAIIISKLVYHDDVRRHGSGNPGTTNMLRAFGKTAALMTLLGDMAKTALAILFAGVIFGFYYVGGISMHDGFCYVAGLFAVLGHVFPVYYKFKGGKGVLATATMALILAPIVFLILFAIFVAIVYFSRYVSLGSVSVAVLLPIVVDGYFKVVFGGAEITTPAPAFVSLSCIVIACLIVWCHRENLQRIGNRTERKLSFKKKKQDDEEQA